MFSFKLIRKLPPPKVQLAVIKSEVAKQVQPVVKQYISRRDAVTSRFNHKPQYVSRLYIRETGILISIYLKNASQKVGHVTIATLMMWLFETGTKPHIIQAKNAKFLAFQGGTYSRKTEGGNGLNGSGEIVFRRQVQHPGFAPSKRFDNIDKRLEPALKSAIDRGTRIGLKPCKK